MSTSTLSFDNNYIKIKNLSYHKDYYYNTTFDLEVCSDGFRGIAEFEQFITSFSKFADELCEMYDFKRQVVVLDDFCYGSTVKFEADNRGHIEVAGNIVGKAMKQKLEFHFVIDQTVLKQFISELRKMIETLYY